MAAAEIKKACKRRQNRRNEHDWVVDDGQAEHHQLVDVEQHRPRGHLGQRLAAFAAAEQQQRNQQRQRRAAPAHQHKYIKEGFGIDLRRRRADGSACGIGRHGGLKQMRRHALQHVAAMDAEKPHDAGKQDVQQSPKEIQPDGRKQPVDRVGEQLPEVADAQERIDEEVACGKQQADDGKRRDGLDGAVVQRFRAVKEHLCGPETGAEEHVESGRRGAADDGGKHTHRAEGGKLEGFRQKADGDQKRRKRRGDDAEHMHALLALLRGAVSKADDHID